MTDQHTIDLIHGYQRFLRTGDEQLAARVSRIVRFFDTPAHRYGVCDSQR